MTVREYIGARYVPLFMGDWDNTETYEPLSVVTYQGNSYTSRQYVPTGIDIDNETYWAETGNYNAQIEQYRSDVQNLSNDVSDLSELIKSKANVMTYGATPDTSELSWQNIINSCIENGNGVYFPNGNWIIDSALDLTNCNFVYGDSAILSFTESFSNFEISTDFDNRFFTMSGIKFDGNSVAQTCITFITGNVGSVNNCHFRNFVDTCIDAQVLGLMIQNCTFIDTTAYENTTDDFSMTGIKCKTDNIIDNCKFLHCKYSIKMVSTTTVSNCYFYGSCYNFKTNYGIVPNSSNGINGRIANSNIINCAFDTIRYSLGSCQRVRIKNCTFLWDNYITTGENSIFYATHSNIAEDVNVSSCHFSSPPNDVSTTYVIKTFSANNDFLNINLAGYQSEKCVKYMRKAADNTHQFNITVGCSNGEIAGNLNSDAVMLECENNYPGSVSKRCIFENGANNLKIALTPTISDSKAIYDWKMFTIQNPVAEVNTNRDIIYLRGTSTTYSKIVLNAGAFNMHSEETTMPTLDFSLDATLLT